VIYRYPFCGPPAARVGRVMAHSFRTRDVEIPDSVFEVMNMVDSDILKADMIDKQDMLATIIRSQTTKHFDKAVADKMAPELIRQDRKIERLVEAVRQLTDLVGKLQKEGR